MIRGGSILASGTTAFQIFAALAGCPAKCPTQLDTKFANLIMQQSRLIELMDGGGWGVIWPTDQSDAPSPNQAQHPKRAG